MANGTPSKAELQSLLVQVGELVSDALDPSLSREEVIGVLQEVNGLLNGEEDDSEEEDDEAKKKKKKKTRQRTKKR